MGHRSAQMKQVNRPAQHLCSSVSSVADSVFSLPALASSASWRSPFRLLASRAGGSGADGVEAFAGRDEEGLAVLAAEADVGGPGFGDGEGLQLFAGLVEDGDALSGEVEVAVGVERDAVRAHLAEELLVLQRAVGAQRVSVRLTRADVGDVERLAVGGADDAIRLLEVVDHARQRLAVGG